jgi:hypothetical protein
MGVVWEAEQEKPQRRVALKTIRPLLVSSHSLHRFELEAEVLGRLEHPNIARIYEAGSHDDGHGPQPFFAMELVRGVRLTEYVAEKGLTTEARLDLLATVCDAVQYAHQQGVIHRDLKPANILVTEDGQPKVLDFGVARVADADLAVTMSTGGGVVGTLPYMAPEQTGGDAARIDARADVYALGVIGYELLAGRPPLTFPGNGLAEAVRIIREEEPSRLGQFDRSFRGDVETIVGKALEKDKTRRYAGAGEMAADIRRYLRYEPIVARPSGTWYVLRKFSRRHKGIMRAVVGAFLALVLGIAGTTAGLVQARRNASAARQARADAQEQLALNLVGSGEGVRAVAILDDLYQTAGVTPSAEGALLFRYWEPRCADLKRQLSQLPPRAVFRWKGKAYFIDSEHGVRHLTDAPVKLWFVQDNLLITVETRTTVVVRRAETLKTRMTAPVDGDEVESIHADPRRRGRFEIVSLHKYLFPPAEQVHNLDTDAGVSAAVPDDLNDEEAVVKRARAMGPNRALPLAELDYPALIPEAASWASAAIDPSSAGSGSDGFDLEAANKSFEEIKAKVISTLVEKGLAVRGNDKSLTLSLSNFAISDGGYRTDEWGLEILLGANGKRAASFAVSYGCTFLVEGHEYVVLAGYEAGVKRWLLIDLSDPRPWVQMGNERRRLAVAGPYLCWPDLRGNLGMIDLPRRRKMQWSPAPPIRVSSDSPWTTSADGSRLAMVSDDGGVWVYALLRDAGECRLERSIYPLAGRSEFVGVYGYREGTLLARTASGEVQLLDTRTGIARWTAGGAGTGVAVSDPGDVVALFSPGDVRLRSYASGAPLGDVFFPRSQPSTSPAGTAARRDGDGVRNVRVLADGAAEFDFEGRRYRRNAPLKRVRDGLGRHADLKELLAGRGQIATPGLRVSSVGPRKTPRSVLAPD